MHSNHSGGGIGSGERGFAAADAIWRIRDGGGIRRAGVCSSSHFTFDVWIETVVSRRWPRGASVGSRYCSDRFVGGLAASKAPGFGGSRHNECLRTGVGGEG